LNLSDREAFGQEVTARRRADSLSSDRFLTPL
jgi:hypothetical protein